MKNVRDDLHTMSAEATGPTYSSGPIGDDQKDLF